MTYAPERYFSDLTVAGVNRVLLHREVYNSLEECGQAIRHAKDYFQEVGLAINPETDIENYHDLPLSSIQIMGVHPGASGQAFLDETYAKIDLVHKQNLNNVVLAVDGGVNEENIIKLKKCGISRFIISSHIFASNNVAQNFKYFIQLVSGGI